MTKSFARINAFLFFVLPLKNGTFRAPMFPAYLFFATLETVWTSIIIWRAWTLSAVDDPEMLHAMQNQGAPI